MAQPSRADAATNAGATGTRKNAIRRRLPESRGVASGALIVQAGEPTLPHYPDSQQDDGQRRDAAPFGISQPASAGAAQPKLIVPSPTSSPMRPFFTQRTTASSAVESFELETDHLADPRHDSALDHHAAARNVDDRNEQFPAPEDDRGALHDAVEAVFPALVGPPALAAWNGDVGQGRPVVLLTAALFLPGSRNLMSWLSPARIAVGNSCIDEFPRCSVADYAPKTLTELLANDPVPAPGQTVRKPRLNHRGSIRSVS